MLRTMIEIDADKCNGCGLCVDACYEGAIGMVGGKARLLRDDHCDGLGNCLPVCPTDAIHFVEREAAAFDEAAVKLHMDEVRSERTRSCDGGCPGAQMQSLQGSANAVAAVTGAASATVAAAVTVGAAAMQTSLSATAPPPQNELRQWPVQIKLMPLNAPYYDGADLLIAADCAAYARADFHVEYMRGKITLIGCPKLDGVDYSEKLGEIIGGNNIDSVTVVRMQVPCCGGIEHAVAAAIEGLGRPVPLRVITLATDGEQIGARTL